MPSFKILAQFRQKATTSEFAIGAKAIIGRSNFSQKFSIIA